MVITTSRVFSTGQCETQHERVRKRHALKAYPSTKCHLEIQKQEPVKIRNCRHPYSPLRRTQRIPKSGWTCPGRKGLNSIRRADKQRQRVATPPFSSSSYLQTHRFWNLPGLTMKTTLGCFPNSYEMSQQVKQLLHLGERTIPSAALTVSREGTPSLRPLDQSVATGSHGAPTT